MSKPFKATKKPVEVDMIELTNDYQSIKDCLEFMGQEVITHGISGLKFHDYCDSLTEGLHIKTMESHGETQIASWGDYIIKGVSGEFYPINPFIAKLTYDIE